MHIHCQNCSHNNFLSMRTLENVTGIFKCVRCGSADVNISHTPTGVRMSSIPARAWSGITGKTSGTRS